VEWSGVEWMEERRERGRMDEKGGDEKWVMGQAAAVT
jgi:hypothetical protein